MFDNMLTIPNGAYDTFFGVLAIIAVIVLIYALGFAEIAKKRVIKAKEAKRLAVEGLNVRKLHKNEMEEYEEEYED